jgi:hypothetical protein
MQQTDPNPPVYYALVTPDGGYSISRPPFELELVHICWPNGIVVSCRFLGTNQESSPLQALPKLHRPYPVGC